MYEAQGYSPLQGAAIGGRTGGDAKCSAAPNRPAGYTRFRAFLSVSARIEIRDMPNNFGVPKMVPVISLTDKLVANNWYDLFDGSINQTLYSAGVLPASVSSGGRAAMRMAASTPTVIAAVGPAALESAESEAASTPTRIG